MKAIQVKYLAETNTLPSRLKVWCEGVKPLILNVDSIEKHLYKNQYQLAAEMLANKLNMLDYCSYSYSEKVLRGGMLPDGSQCFVVVAIPYDVRESFNEFTSFLQGEK